jgi:hypothetical protein
MGKEHKALLIGGVILILFPLILFVIKFWDLGLSDDPKNWVDFGDLYYGIIGLLLTGYIAIVVNRLNIRNSRIGLQFEAYKEIVRILTSLTDDIKPMKKTNKEIDNKICEMLIQLHHFEENYTFLFDKFDRMKFIQYEQKLINSLNEFRKLPSNDIFGINGNWGTDIINSTNMLLFEIQRVMK